MKPIEKVREHFKAVLQIKTSPSQIAIGFAIGTFFANFPTLGLEFIIIILILAIFKKISKISVALAYAIWNPLITYPLAGVGYLVGNYILGDAPRTLIKFWGLNGVANFTLRFLLGSLILATIFAVIGYFIVYYIIKEYQRRKYHLGIQKFPALVQISEQPFSNNKTL